MRNLHTSSEDGEWLRLTTDMVEQRKPGPTQLGGGAEQQARLPQAHQHGVSGLRDTDHSKG